MQPITTRDVHLWIATLDADPDTTADLWDVLSRDERQRALRFKFAVDRERYVLARGILRKLVS
jgi:4'-phosphopantetheinyl transferase